MIFNEADILKQCAQNDRQAQEILYRRFFQPMLQWTLRYTNGDRDKALDIVNDGFLRVFKKIHLFEARGSLEGWIRRLVFHAMSDYYKAHKKNITQVFLDELPPENGQNTWDTEGVFSDLYFEDLVSLVERLPAATQAVFKLYAIEGYSHIEISTQLNIAVGTSKWHLSNARERLQDMLKKIHVTR